MSDTIQHHIAMLKRTIASLERELSRAERQPAPLEVRCPQCGGTLVQRRNKQGELTWWVQCEKCGTYYLLTKEEGHKVRE